MNLQKKIKQDLVAAMKARDQAKKDAIRVIMGEFGRQDKKELADEDIIPILKKLVKSEKETLEQTGGDRSDFLDVVESYLPKMADESEISAWIEENVDFSRFKNRMQAMRPIMQHFGSSADGNLVKAMLQKM